MKKLVVLSLCFLLILPVAFSQLVIINSLEWEDLYLASVYAGQNGDDILFFQNLADANIKSQTIDPKEQILIYESSSRPVVKNYRKFLEVNRFEDVSSISYSDYQELQEQLFEYDTKPIILLYPEFGIEAIAVAPLISSGKYVPYFLTGDSKQYIEPYLSEDDIIAGYFPIRHIEGLPGERFTHVPDINANNLTLRTAQVIESPWGVINAGDIVDLQVLRNTYPIFVYTGSSSDIGNIVKQTPIRNFEVIGPGLANVAQAVEIQSGVDLKLILKYGRSFTGIQGLEGQILNLDSAEFPIPRLALFVDDVTYYDEMNILGVTLANSGNTDVQIFPNIEFAQTPLTLNNIYTIRSGQKVTIPFFVEADEYEQAVLNIQYGLAQPLRFFLQDDEGVPLLRETVQTSNLNDQSTITFTSLQLEKGAGRMFMEITNPNEYEIKAVVEAYDNITSQSLTSKKVTIPAMDSMLIPIDVSYTPDSALLAKRIPVSAYYGKEATILQSNSELLVIEYVEESYTLYYIIGILILVALILFALWKFK